MNKTSQHALITNYNNQFPVLNKKRKRVLTDLPLLVIYLTKLSISHKKNIFMRMVLADEAARSTLWSTESDSKNIYVIQRSSLY